MTIFDRAERRSERTRLAFAYPPTRGSSAFAAQFDLPLGDLGSGAVNTVPSVYGGSPTATFARTTLAWTILLDGTIGLVASNTARSYYFPNGTYGGYLSEAQRINRCLQSQNFSITWVAVGTPTITGGNVTAGVLSLDLIGDDSAVALEGYTQAITFVGDATKAISVYVKQGTATSSVIRLRDTTVPADRLLAAITWSGTEPVVTMTTGTDLTGTVSVQQLGTSGIYRLSFLATAVTAANTNSLEAYPATDAALDVTATGTINIGGWNCEDAAFSSTYIPTTTAVVTRSGDALSYPSSGNVDATVGTLYCEGSLTHSVGTGATEEFVSFGGSIARGLLILTAASVGNIISTADGPNNLSKSGLPSFVNAVGKFALSWGGAGMALTGGGLSPGTSAFDGDQNITNISIGTDGVANGRPLFGTVKNVRFWKSQLSNAQLQAITV